MEGEQVAKRRRAAVVARHVAVAGDHLRRRDRLHAQGFSRIGAAVCCARCSSASRDSTGACFARMRTRYHAPEAEDAVKALGRAGEWGAVWVAIGLGAAAVDADATPALAARRRRRARRRRGQLPGQARGAPAAPAAAPPAAAGQRTQRALVPVGPRNLVAGGGDRDGPRRSGRPAAALRPRRRDLPDPPLPRHALPLRRAGRRGARPADRRGCGPGCAGRAPRTA